MKTKTLLSLIVVLVMGVACTSNRTKVSTVVNGVQIESPKYNVKVQFYGEKLARVTKWSADGSADKKCLVVLNHNLPALNVAVEETPEAVVLKTSAVVLNISKTDGTIKYTEQSGNVVLQEQGTSLFSPIVYAGDSGFTVQQNFKLTPDEGVYGLGQHQEGYFNYRGKNLTLVQSNTNAVNPFLISTNHYGILWDNYSKTIFNDDAKGASLWSDMGSNIDYYFVYGENMDSVISGYRTLTGKAPMYGKYAYGYWQSKEHYDTQDELMTVARKYRKLQIPIDNMIQDWDYWDGAANWSGMFFSERLFPDPKAMMDELHAKNFHAIISIWPALGPNTEIYKEMEKNRNLIDVVGWAGFKYMDTYKPGTNALYWKYLKSGIYSKGLDGWWIDSTEPDVVNALTKESTDYEMKKMGCNYLGSWARYLNPYSLVMTDDIYKFWREETSERRAYILTRSCFAGQQRNAATTWSGDIGASWEVYRNQISAGTNHCMAGIPYWTFDIGGFVLGAYEGVFMTGGKNPAYQELYNRMFQFGAFAPIFRSHGSETPREIWEMGEFSDALLKFDNLRYRLMPYIYSQAWKVTSQDYTYMRGLPMDFADDKNTYNIDDQFMFGPSLLVCPVTDYMYHTPPQASVLMGSEYFKTNSGETGLKASYYKDNKYQVLGKEQIDSTIDVFWYTGRPNYVTDSMFAIRWEGKLLPKISGKHQFHMKSFDKKRIILNGDTLPIVYTSVEQYTAPIELEAGKEYSFVVETENTSTGAARMRLFVKDPSIFAKEVVKAEREKTKEVYLPAGTTWFDFWTGKTYQGGQKQVFDAPKDRIPLLVKAGSIIPMGPFVQYATEKPAGDYEIRIYRGADGKFVIYEDENDNYNYEKGAYAEIELDWNDQQKQLTIGDRKGTFAGLVVERKYNIVLVDENKGTDIALAKPDKLVVYNGTKQIIQF